MATTTESRVNVEQLTSEFLTGMESQLGRPLTEQEKAQLVEQRIPRMVNNINSGRYSYQEQLGNEYRRQLPALREQALQNRQEETLQVMQEGFLEQNALARRVTESQLEDIEASRERDRLFTPLMLESLGFKGEFDPGGNLSGITRFSEEELVGRMSPLEKMQYEIAQEQSKRQLKALRGELDVDPALTEEIQKNEKLLRESLSRALGPNYEKSTVGQQALQDFTERATRITEGARRGEIAQGTTLLSSALANNEATRGAGVGRVAGAIDTFNVPAANRSAAQVNAMQPGSVVQGTGVSLLSSYATAQQPYQFNRQLESQERMQRRDQSFARRMANLDFASQLFGASAGAAASYYGGGAGGAR